MCVAKNGELGELDFGNRLAYVEFGRRKESIFPSGDIIIREMKMKTIAK